MTKAALAVLLLAGRLHAAPAPRNVVLVTTDGLRWQEVFSGAEMSRFAADESTATVAEFWRPTPAERRRALLPFMWNVIAARGQLWGNRALGSSVRVTNGFNISYPGYSELLTGFADPAIDNNKNIPNPNMSVLEWLDHKPAFEGRVAAFGNWDRIVGILNRDRSRLRIMAPGDEISEKPLTEREAIINSLQRDVPPRWEGETFDAFTHAAAMNYLERHQPRVLYVLYEETDEWAHEGRYADYLKAARRFDDFLSRLWDRLQSMPQYKGNTTLLVSTDHGRGDGPQWTDHGAKVAGSENVWFAALGPDIPAKGERSTTPPATQSQFAATAAASVGENYPAAVKRAASPIDFSK
jgi:hypothetical protein